MLGESLGALTLRELKNLENRVERGISRIRSKKVLLVLINLHFIVFSLLFDIVNYMLLSISQNELLFAEIEYMQKRVSSIYALVFCFNYIYILHNFIDLLVIMLSPTSLYLSSNVNNIGSRRSTYITTISTFEQRSLSFSLARSI